MGLLGTLGGIAGSVFGGPVGGAIGGALGGLFDDNPAEDAANAANAATDRSIALQQRMYEEGVARQKPFYEAGVNALPEYLKGIGQNGELVRGFTQADYQADPGYAFRLSEGQKALDRSAAARGGLISGAALKAAGRYGQDMASQEYSNAYNRYRDTQGLRRNALAGVVGFAPTAAGSMTTSGQNYATNAGNAMIGQGVNTGNALIAGANARESAYGNLGSAFGKYLSNSGGYNYTPFGGGSTTFGEGEY